MVQRRPEKLQVENKTLSWVYTELVKKLKEYSKEKILAGLMVYFPRCSNQSGDFQNRINTVFDASNIENNKFLRDGTLLLLARANAIFSSGFRNSVI